MTVNYQIFYDPYYGGQGIAHSWIDKATRAQRGGYPTHEQFDRLICLWMAFNAWGMCVTLAESDATMLRALGRDGHANRVFDEILSYRGDLREKIASEEHNFPLPSFADLIRLDPLYDWRGPRDTRFWQKIAEAPRGKHPRISPKLDHRNLNLPDTLACIYKVRCNLVHGGKMASPREESFVGVFADVLEALLTERPRNFLNIRDDDTI